MKSAKRIMTKETREYDGPVAYESFVDGFAAVYRLNRPLWGYRYIKVHEIRSMFDGWKVTVFPVTADGEVTDELHMAPFEDFRKAAPKTEEFSVAGMDSFIKRYGYEVVG